MEDSFTEDLLNEMEANKIKKVVKVTKPYIYKKQEEKTMTVIIKKMQKIVNDKPGTKAFVDISINGQVSIMGLNVVETKTGELFVSYPESLNVKTNVRYNIITVDDLELKQEIEEKILALYRR